MWVLQHVLARRRAQHPASSSERSHMRGCALWRAGQRTSAIIHWNPYVVGRFLEGQSKSRRVVRGIADPPLVGGKGFPLLSPATQSSLIPHLYIYPQPSSPRAMATRYAHCARCLCSAQCALPRAASHGQRDACARARRSASDGRCSIWRWFCCSTGTAWSASAGAATHSRLAGCAAPCCGW